MQAYLHRLKGRLLEEPGIRHFVPLHFRQDSIHSTIKTINDAFMQLSRFVITGQAGSGKTTMIRRLALQLVNDCLGDEKVKQMPIWFTLSEWDDKQPLEKFVRSQWVNIENPFETMYQNNAIVFLDGLDELGAQTTQKVHQLNEWLNGSYPPYKIVATCRTEYFSSLNFNLQTIELVAELTDVQICKFAHHYLQEVAEQFLALIMMDTPDCYELSKTQLESGVTGVVTDSAYLKRLHSLLDAHFSLEEVRLLCFNLGVDFDNLRGEGKTAKARELVSLLNRKGLLSNLLNEISEERPNVTWPNKEEHSQPRNLDETLQAMAIQYTNGKDIKFLLQIITQTWDRVTDERSYFANIYHPFVVTPFQIVELFQFFQTQLFHNQLPLNLGKVTDFIVQKVWERERERKAKGWVSYEEVAEILSQYAYSIKSAETDDSPCYPRLGFSLIDTLGEFDHSLEQIQHNNGNITNMRVSNETAKLLIGTLISARILELVEVESDYNQELQQCICFTDARFLEYFAAFALKDLDFETTIQRLRFNASWQRIARYFDRVVINLCVLVKDHNIFLQNMAEKDAIVTAKCIASLGPKQIPDSLRERTINRLINIMQEVYDAGEARSVACAKLLYLLADTSTIPAMINTIEQLNINEYRFAIAQIFVRFGKEALPALLGRLDTTQTRVFPSVIRAIGRIGDPRTQDDLRKALRAIEPSDTWLYAPTLVALIRTGDREATMEFFERVSEMSRNNKIQLKNWLYGADLDVDIIPHFVNILHTQPNEQTTEIMEMIVFAFGAKASPTLIALLNQLAADPEDQTYTLTAVIESLSSIGEQNALSSIRTFLDVWENELVCLSAIKAVGILKDQKAVGKLISLTSYDKEGSENAVWIRAYSAIALGRIGDPQAIRALSLLLDDHEPVFMGERKEVCAFAADSLREIDTTESRALALDWYKNRLFNSPPKSSEAQHAYVGLAKIATNQAFEIIHQWESSR